MEIKLKEMRQQTLRTKNGIAMTARISNDWLHLGREKKIKWRPALKFLWGVMIRERCSLLVLVGKREGGGRKEGRGNITKENVLQWGLGSTCNITLWWKTPDTLPWVSLREEAAHQLRAARAEADQPVFVNYQRWTKKIPNLRIKIQDCIRGALSGSQRGV